MKEHSQAASPSPRADTAAPHVAHTPGPWTVGYLDGSGNGMNNGAWDGNGACIVAARNATVVRGGDSFGCNYGVLREGDAHLIAAAPEMYEALKHAIGLIEAHVPQEALGESGDGAERWPLRDEYLHYMRQAVAKAEGTEVGSHGTAVLSEASATTPKATLTEDQFVRDELAASRKGFLRSLRSGLTVVRDHCEAGRSHTRYCSGDEEGAPCDCGNIDPHDVIDAMLDQIARELQEFGNGNRASAGTSGSVPSEAP